MNERASEKKQENDSGFHFFIAYIAPLLLQNTSRPLHPLPSLSSPNGRDDTFSQRIKEPRRGLL